ncbi:unnamed protein product [Ilex paraguariensis]|uniref:Bifunctional inhibitor/plant lipid transfer protein/seed storage helical domain-containing protein n=1 Tax=Ilex paraguariensis TaxID=185542 RepID=A0ABC8UB46_9AQUA
MSINFPSSTTLFFFLNILFFVTVSGQAPSVADPPSAPVLDAMDNNSSQPMSCCASLASMDSNSSSLMSIFGSPPPLMTPNCTCSINTKRLIICYLPLYGVQSSPARLACCLQLRFLGKAKARSSIYKTINDKILRPVIQKQVYLLLLACHL